ncbi:MAG TPA: hypothetical protein PKD26_15610 [Pyrinomonadaceae bacterium]|nr:hypothetical protein [Pyrinomonadaceae bacterium]
MAKEVITIDGKETVVREDMAKAFRGVHWALISIAAFILITALLFFAGFLRLASDGDLDKTPAATERNRGN